MIRVWSLNDLVMSKGSAWRTVAELSQHFQDGLRAVAKELKQLRRAMVGVGGFAEMRGLDQRWDDHVHTVRRMFTHEGILTIIGTPFYRTVQSTSFS